MSILPKPALPVLSSPVQSSLSKLLLALANAAILGFGPHRNPWSNFCSFQDKIFLSTVISLECTGTRKRPCKGICNLWTPYTLCKFTEMNDIYATYAQNITSLYHFKICWLLGRKSKLCTNNKLHIYKTILKLIWTYRIQLWGTASTSNIETLERFQSKALRMIFHASWSLPNTVIWRDLQIRTVNEEIRRYSSQYRAHLSAHPNDLIVNLIELPDNRRLRRHLPNDLPTRFLV
jgi:hypothetical protein